MTLSDAAAKLVAHKPRLHAGRARGIGARGAFVAVAGVLLGPRYAPSPGGPSTPADHRFHPDVGLIPASRH